MHSHLLLLIKECNDFGVLFVAVLTVCQGGRSEARPLIAVFGMSAASKQNGKLIDSCGGAEENVGGGVCMRMDMHVSCKERPKAVL